MDLKVNKPLTVHQARIKVATNAIIGDTPMISFYGVKVHSEIFVWTVSVFKALCPNLDASYAVKRKAARIARDAVMELKD